MEETSDLKERGMKFSYFDRMVKDALKERKSEIKRKKKLK